MKIGMIGAGKIGATLAGRYAAAGHAVVLANSRGPESLSNFASEMGAKAGTVGEAIADADVVVVSIPQKSIPLLSEDFASAREDLIVVDTGNYMPFRDGRIEEIEAGMVESEWVQRQLGRPVVKVYNSIMAESLQHFCRPAGANGRIALPVAGDDDRAKRIVMELVDVSGFDAWDSGPIAESWRQQPGMAAYCTDLTLNELPAALAMADRMAGPAIRNAFAQELLEGWDRHSAADRIAIIRRHQQRGIDQHPQT
jgi:8-hydroxy-5-deazaflavin:NADPH oxidoreductase